MDDVGALLRVHKDLVHRIINKKSWAQRLASFVFARTSALGGSVDRDLLLADIIRLNQKAAAMVPPENADSLAAPTGPENVCAAYERLLTLLAVATPTPKEADAFEAAVRELTPRLPSPARLPASAALAVGSPPPKPALPRSSLPWLPSAPGLPSSPAQPIASTQPAAPLVDATAASDELASAARAAEARKERCGDVLPSQSSPSDDVSVHILSGSQTTALTSATSLASAVAAPVSEDVPAAAAPHIEDDHQRPPSSPLAPSSRVQPFPSGASVASLLPPGRESPPPPPSSSPTSGRRSSDASAPSRRRTSVMREHESPTWRLERSLEVARQAAHSSRCRAAAAEAERAELLAQRRALLSELADLSRNLSEALALEDDSSRLASSSEMAVGGDVQPSNAEQIRARALVIRAAVTADYGALLAERASDIEDSQVVWELVEHLQADLLSARIERDALLEEAASAQYERGSASDRLRSSELHLRDAERARDAFTARCEELEGALGDAQLALQSVELERDSAMEEARLEREARAELSAELDRQVAAASLVQSELQRRAAERSEKLRAHHAAAIQLSLERDSAVEEASRVESELVAAVQAAETARDEICAIKSAAARRDATTAAELRELSTAAHALRSDVVSAEAARDAALIRVEELVASRDRDVESLRSELESVRATLAASLAESASWKSETEGVQREVAAVKLAATEERKALTADLSAARAASDHWRDQSSAFEKDLLATRTAFNALVEEKTLLLGDVASLRSASDVLATQAAALEDAARLAEHNFRTAARTVEVERASLCARFARLDALRLSLVERVFGQTPEHLLHCASGDDSDLSATVSETLRSSLVSLEMWECAARAIVALCFAERETSKQRILAIDARAAATLSQTQEHLEAEIVLLRERMSAQDAAHQAATVEARESHEAALAEVKSSLSVALGVADARAVALARDAEIEAHKHQEIVATFFAERATLEAALAALQVRAGVAVAFVAQSHFLRRPHNVGETRGAG